MTDVGHRSPEPDEAAPGWSVRRVAYGDPDAVALTEEVQEIYVERYGGPDATPLDPLMFDPPEGSFFVGYLSGVPAASGAWRRSSVGALGVEPSSGTAVEIKRMYVRPVFWRRGLARRMLAHLEADAAAAGARLVVLETGDRQPEAIELYLSSGYTAIPGFGYYADSPVSRSFAKLLHP